MENNQNAFAHNNFDLIRLFAATQVMIFHTYYHFHQTAPLALGFFTNFPGVPIFFAVSGFLISKSYENRSSLRAYSLARALRIFPGLWMIILLSVFVFSLYGVHFLTASGIKWFILQLCGVIYTPSFMEHFGIGSYNGSLWTIMIELQFYFALPILYLPKNKHRFNTYLLCAFIVFFGISTGLYITFPNMGSTSESHLEKLMRYSLFPHFYLFLLGAIIQRYSLYKHKMLSNKGAFWLAGYITITRLLPAEKVYSTIRESLLAVTFIALSYTAPGISKRILKGNDISYGIYIYHGLFVNIFIASSIMIVSANITAAILFCCVYVISFASWKFIERQALNFKKRLI